MKTGALLCLMAVGLSANAQDKLSIFVQGKGSENVSSTGSGGGGQHWAAWGSKSTIDAHDESREVTKDRQKDCSGATITINESSADYVIMMNRRAEKMMAKANIRRGPITQFCITDSAPPIGREFSGCERPRPVLHSALWPGRVDHQDETDGNWN